MMCVFSLHKQVNLSLQQNARVWRKHLWKTANYLPAIPLLKMSIPPAVHTNPCLCGYACIPVYMSWAGCVYYLCMSLL